MTAGDRSTFLTKTGWGQSGTLTAGNKTQRVTMQADFNKGVGAFDFTCQFSVTAPGGRSVVNAEALVSWRVEGQEVTRRITIGAGASLTGVGQAVRVEIYDATPPNFYQSRRVAGTVTVTEGSDAVVFSAAPGLPLGSTLTFSAQPKVQYFIEAESGTDVTLTAPYTGPSRSSATATTAYESNITYGVGVQVSAGARGSNAQPPLLQPYDGPPYTVFDANNPAPGGGFLFVVNPGDVLPIAIPEDAGVNQVFITVFPLFGGFGGVPTDTAIASIENGIGDQRTWDTQVNKEWIPVPPGAQTLLVSNNSTGGRPGPLRFGVAFGIEG
jgi:hypothetical protein